MRHFFEYAMRSFIEERLIPPLRYVTPKGEFDLTYELLMQAVDPSTTEDTCVLKSETCHWLWDGPRTKQAWTSQGYKSPKPILHLNGRREYVSRLLYSFTHDTPIQSRIRQRPTCKFLGCINPFHRTQPEMPSELRYLIFGTLQAENHSTHLKSKNIDPDDHILPPLSLPPELQPPPNPTLNQKPTTTDQAPPPPGSDPEAFIEYHFNEVFGYEALDIVDDLCDWLEESQDPLKLKTIHTWFNDYCTFTYVDDNGKVQKEIAMTPQKLILETLDLCPVHLTKRITDYEPPSRENPFD